MSAPLPLSDQLASLAGFGDAASLRSAISDLCGQFGKPSRIDVLTVTEAKHRRALCFLKLESQVQEQQMIKALGITRFGDELLLIVELREDQRAG